MSECIYRHITRRATSRGMVVNTKKTGMLVISGAQSYKPEAHIFDSDGTRIDSGDSLKMLGFHFSGQSNVHAHIKILCRRFRQQMWVLTHLCRFGFSEEELVRVYKSIVRPVADYCCVIYHYILTDYEDEEIDRLQAQALKRIFGFSPSYAEMREKAGLETWRNRRIAMIDKFVGKCLDHDHFSDWFPL